MDRRGGDLAYGMSCLFRLAYGAFEVGSSEETISVALGCNDDLMRTLRGGQIGHRNPSRSMLYYSQSSSQYFLKNQLTELDRRKGYSGQEQADRWQGFRLLGGKDVAWKLRSCRSVTSYITVQDAVRGTESVSNKIVRMEDDVMMKKSRTRRSTGTEEL